MRTYFPYVAGEFVETNEFIDVIEKYTGKVFAHAGAANASLLEKSISAAKNVEITLSQMSSGSKNKILMQIAENLMTEKEHFAEMLAMEAGKPLRYALIEVERAAQTFMTAAEEAKRMHSEILSLDWFPHGEKKEAIIKMFPVGSVAGITPFNFPINLVAHKVAPAIAAGCPIILKPASATPISSLELARIIHQTDLPKGAFSVLPMSHAISNPLLTDSRIKKISFTGSPNVGWQMKQECGRKKITLELGGNSAAIITESANLKEAVAKCVTGAFAFSGQVCIHTQRIYVQKEIFEKFISAFLEKTATLKRGNPLDTTTDISIMIDEINAVRIESWVNQAISEGAKLLTGGNRSGNYFEPTVLTNTNSAMNVWKDEVFGPVVIIEPFESFQDAVDMVNKSVFGLQAGVFTNKIDELNNAYREIEAGAILINESPTYRIDHMPYGGVKESGFGREGVKYAIQEMCEMKVLVKPI